MAATTVQGQQSEDRCDLLRVAPGEAKRALDARIEQGRAVRALPVESAAELRRARSRMAAWSAGAERLLGELFVDPAAARVYRRAAGPARAAMPVMRAAAMRDFDARVRRLGYNVDARLEELEAVRAWLDQCH